MAETRALRSDAGASCTGLTSPRLLGAAQSSVQTQLLSNGVEHAWTVAESARGLEAGSWAVTLRVTTAGPNQAAPAVRVRVERRNSSCAVQETVIDETQTLANSTTQDYTYSDTAGAVTLGEGDRLVVIVNRTNATNRTATLQFAGSSPDDSRLVHPDQASEEATVVDVDAAGETVTGGEAGFRLTRGHLVELGVS